MVNEILSAVVRWFPSPLIQTFNTSLSSASFPIEWKTAKIVLLGKDYTKPVDHPSSYRPLSLLDGAGKILKRLIFIRVAHLVTEGLSPNQYGFCPGRGIIKTIEAVLSRATDAARGVVQGRHLCVLVTLNIRNAFNSAPWEKIDTVI